MANAKQVQLTPVKKAWQTRRANARAAALSTRANKAWATRRANKAAGK